MAPLRYSINLTLDGCCDHLAGMPDAELHRQAAETIERADTLLFGRVVYQMMEEAWRLPEGTDPASADPFAATIHRARKRVVSSTLTHVDWNAELVTGDLADAVRQIKEESQTGVLTGGVQLPLALAGLGLIDEYQLVVHPRVAGHGPWLFAGLPAALDLELTDREDLASGIVVNRYRPRP